VGVGYWITLMLVRLKKVDRLGLSVSLGFYRADIGCAFASYFVSGQSSIFLEEEVFIWLLGLLALLEHFSTQSLSGNNQALFIKTAQHTPQLAGGSFTKTGFVISTHSVGLSKRGVSNC